MTALFTRTNLFAIALTVVCATSPSLAQQARQAAPAKRTTTTPAKTSAAPSATTPQRAKVSPGSPTASVAKPSTTAAKPSTTPDANSQASTKPAEVASTATAPERPRAGVQSASVQPRSTSTRSTQSIDGKRQIYLNAGIGLAAYYGGGLPLGISAEFDLKNNISVGGSVDYLRYGYNSGGYRWNYTFVYAGARGSYHLGEILNIGDSKFDPYVGATLGFRYAGYNDNYDYGYDYSSPYNSGLFLGAHLGSRYMFSPKIGGFAEVGYGVSALRLGITAKL